MSKSSAQKRILADVREARLFQEDVPVGTYSRKDKVVEVGDLKLTSHGAFDSVRGNPIVDPVLALKCQDIKEIVTAFDPRLGNALVAPAVEDAWTDAKIDATKRRITFDMHKQGLFECMWIETYNRESAIVIITGGVNFTFGSDYLTRWGAFGFELRDDRRITDPQTLEKYESLRKIIERRDPEMGRRLKTYDA